MLSMLKNHSILYVEDELEIQANIAEYLGNFFNEIYLASDGEGALEQYNKYHPDVLLLDINLPKIDGLSVAQKIREQDDTVKIIMLTAFTEKEKLLKATELKLTKYLIKPVSPIEFKAVLKILANELISNPSRFLKMGEYYVWDKSLEALSYKNTPIELSEKEHRLLKIFILSKGNSVSYDKIITAVWGDAFDREISIDSVKNQVSQLRRKLPEGCISSVYGEGYILK